MVTQPALPALPESAFIVGSWVKEGGLWSNPLDRARVEALVCDTRPMTTPATRTPWPDPVVLEGQHARLEPLRPDHAGDLARASAAGALWRLWYTHVPSPEGMAAEIERRLGLRAQGSMLPFAVIRRSDGLAVGMTTYMNIDADNRRVEIGSTWYARSVQRTPINTECKLMLLTHAFEGLGCIAVEFRTHFFNHASRRAIERLGAKLDGVLRSHMIGPDGALRDTCVYSVIASEWPAVRTHLRWQLERPRDSE